MTIEQPIDPEPRRRRRRLAYLTIVLVVVSGCAVLAHCRNPIPPGGLDRYELRVDRADGRVESDVLILHGGGTFVYVRQHWRAGAKAATIQTYGTVGEWRTGVFGRALLPRRTWDRLGMDFRGLRSVPVAGNESIAWQQPLETRRAGIRLAASAMTGRSQPLVIPLVEQIRPWQGH